ncbi:MAG: hypothetical protein SOZ53_00140 [Candidatus Onthovivens sp.]|nr:hypothetical protein [Candidatus Onthovivens sp.]
MNNKYYYDNDNNKIKIDNSAEFNVEILKKSETLKVDKVMNKTAKLVTVAPKEDDFLYIRNRAVSAGNVIPQPDGSAISVPIDEYYKNFEKYSKICRNANDNGDFFSEEELKSKYKTFIGKSAFVDHNNENVENARGIIVDAVWNDRGKFVELLKAVDKKAYPELARGIEKGYITDTSMGCRCGKSICSICGNVATTEDEFCDHIKNYKGSTYNGLPVFEDNRDVDFFEDSFVTIGADPEAKILEKVASRSQYCGVQRISKSETRDLSYIINEKNQRTFSGRVESFAEKLKNIPWS